MHVLSNIASVSKPFGNLVCGTAIQVKHQKEKREQDCSEFYYLTVHIRHTASVCECVCVCVVCCVCVCVCVCV